MDGHRVSDLWISMVRIWTHHPIETTKQPFIPGDSIRDLLIPQLEVMNSRYLKGHVNSLSQKGHELAELPGQWTFQVPGICARV